MAMQISGVTIQGGMNILPAGGSPSPSPAPTPGPSDPNFSNVVFLFDGDGTNGADNNTFTDSSTNSHAVTESGSVVQGSFSPYGDNWSNYFDGASNADLVIADSDNLSAEDQDFTLEAWVYVENAGGSNKAIWSKWGSGAQEILLGISSNNLVAYIQTYSLGTPLLTSSTNISSGWNHVALTRNGNDFNLWLNGVNTASATQAGSIQNQTADVTIGDYVDGGWQYYGYISNLRWVKGTAVYTSAFTPSAAPLTAITNTQLLTCQSNRFVDGSTNKHSVAINNTVKVTPFSPFTNSDARDITTDGGSAYFDSNYLDTSSLSNFNLSSGNWTIEGWLYTIDTSYGERYVVLEGSSQNFGLIRGNNNTVEWNFFGTSALITSSTNSVLPNSWVHFAVVSNSGTITLYIDGVSQGTTTTYPQNSNTQVTLAASVLRYTSTSTNTYISDVRIVKGTAVYTSAFTPPTSPLTAITNTELLLNFQDAGIYDYSGLNNIDTVGNAQISTSIKKFGTGSIKFDGTGDYLDTVSTEALTFGTGDFTIEFWINTSNDGNIMNPSTATGSGYWGLLMQSGNLRWNNSYNVSNLWQISASTIQDGSWHHVAISRASGSTKIFYDGTLQSTQTDTTDYSGTGAWRIGSGNLAAFNGYLDDFRVTKGVARYTSNFTAPTAAFPTS